MNNLCSSCSRPFEITDEDHAFYTDLDLPAPTSCPSCREQRRMAWCNEGILYPGQKCKKCERSIISQYHPDNPREVWCVDCWWADDWDPKAYGQDIDLNRSILEQIHQLELAVPHACTNTDLESENSEYTHHAGHEKHCYMLFHTSFAEECLYGYGIKKALSCVDNHYCFSSELCYECIDVIDCYDCAWAQDCTNCSSCRFVRDCIGCKNCFLCTGLRNAEYCMLNEKLGKEEYQKRLAEINLGSKAVILQLLERFETLQKQHAYKHLQMEMVENSVGDHLYKAKDSQYCFDVSDSEGCRYCTQLQLGARFCTDIYQFGIQIERCTECSMIGYNVYNCHFCHDLLEQCSDLYYCISCFSSKNCFGCVGLKNARYCILNKQYSEEEYDRLTKQMKQKMQNTCHPSTPLRMTSTDKTENVISSGVERRHSQNTPEWANFFPIKYSPHGYNETMANEWYPLSREEVIQKDWHWEDNLPFTTGRGTVDALPDTIADVSDDIVDEILTCDTCDRNYKIIPQELKFYRTHNFPLPWDCFACRRQRRFNKRNKRELRDVACGECGEGVKTTYRDELKVLCEGCYREWVY